MKKCKKLSGVKKGTRKNKKKKKEVIKQEGEEEKINFVGVKKAVQKLKRGKAADYDKEGRILRNGRDNKEVEGTYIYFEEMLKMKYKDTKEGRTRRKRRRKRRRRN